jgi:hypothetical protein
MLLLAQQLGLLQQQRGRRRVAGCAGLVHYRRTNERRPAGVAQDAASQHQLLPEAHA